MSTPQKTVELEDDEYQPTESPILSEQAHHDISGSGSMLEEVNISMVERYFIRESVTTTEF